MSPAVFGVRTAVVGARAVLFAVVGAASAGCGLSDSASIWQVEIVDAGDGGEVAFCPVTGAGGVASGFVPDVNAVVALSVENDDIYTFSQPGVGFPGSGTMSTAMFEVFGNVMTFDLGPLGLPYDDAGTAALVVGGVPVRRTLVGGQRKGDDEIELTQEMVPECTEVQLADGTSCSCASRRLTWRFSGIE